MNNAFSSKAILANQMQFLNKLRKITVRDCSSIQVVYDLKGLSAKEGDVGLLPSLNELKLINLPMLTQLCNKVPNGILDLSKLKVLKIDNCSRFKYAFTWSMASCLFHLQEIQLKCCEMMESIIMEKENEEEDVSQVTFSSLKEISITECPSIKALFISTDIHFTHQVSILL